MERLRKEVVFKSVILDNKFSLSNKWALFSRIVLLLKAAKNIIIKKETCEIKMYQLKHK